jgi:hypothetical protein
LEKVGADQQHSHGAGNEHGKDLAAFEELHVSKVGAAGCPVPRKVLPFADNPGELAPPKRVWESAPA